MKNETIEIRDLPETESERELSDEELDLAVGGMASAAPETCKDTACKGETD